MPKRVVDRILTNSKEDPNALYAAVHDRFRSCETMNLVERRIDVIEDSQKQFKLLVD